MKEISQKIYLKIDQLKKAYKQKTISRTTKISIVKVKKFLWKKSTVQMQPAAFETVQHKKYRKVKKKISKENGKLPKRITQNWKVKKHIKRVIFF